MNIELYVPEISMYAFSEWEEINEKKENDIWNVIKKEFEKVDDFFSIELCKFYKKYKVSAVAADTNTSVISIITGVAIAALGFAIAPVTAGGSTILIGLGGSLIGNAFYDELKEASKSNVVNKKPPEQFDSSIINMRLSI